MKVKIFTSGTRYIKRLENEVNEFCALKGPANIRSIKWMQSSVFDKQNLITIITAVVQYEGK